MLIGMENGIGDTRANPFSQDFSFTNALEEDMNPLESRLGSLALMDNHFRRTLNSKLTATGLAKRG